jgi:uncharacterized protein with NAD-binding domain and iron-sulfur cluster
VTAEMVNQRPAYIHTGGSVVLHSPLQLQRAELHGFFVKGDLDRLQHSIDATLNRVAAGRMEFKALSPYTMLTFTQVSHANSAYCSDKAKGWTRETDIVTWILVGAMQNEGGREKLSHLYWYPFHIWVDDGMALINGRELFGYPKYPCEYVIPARGSDPDLFSVSVRAFETFSEQTESMLHPLLEVKSIEQAEHRPLRNVLGLFWQALELFKSIPDFLNLDAAGWKDIASLIRWPRIDQIFLKQFPDSTGDRAVYQAIVAAPASVNGIQGGSLLGHKYQCTLHPVASFPLHETLGIQPGQQPVLLPFRLNFDFTVSAGEELVDNSRIAPRRIAVLGGGVAAMTAVFYLTEQPGWQNRYDITVYQMGWRLGGKCASGRNARAGRRIEEHGLHVWFGSYENAFAMIRRIYDLLDRPEGAPLRTWQDALKPHSYLALAEKIQDEWKIWPMEFPEKRGVPGDGGEEITPWQMALTILEWGREWSMELLKALGGTGRAWQALRGFAGRMTEAWNFRGDRHQVLAEALKGFRDCITAACAGVLHGNDDLRRLFIGVDLATTVLCGMCRDGVFRRGFDVINRYDFREWLRRHGASEAFTVNSSLVTGCYDLVFGYRNGDVMQPNVEAGTLLRAMLRMALCYKGGVMWKMQAGMGDTMFTPLYEVLKERGVKFKFFYKVEELVPDGDTVGEIRFSKQATVVRGEDEYEPLVDVKGLACWPSEPDYRQLAVREARLLEAHGVNLESHWSNWPEIYRQNFGTTLPQVTLKKGCDFDDVIFGISVGALPHLCPKLLERSAPLRMAAEKVETVATQAYQVWMKEDVGQLGGGLWPVDGREPVLSGFAEPFDSWASMQHLLPMEDWPRGAEEPKNVSYFCSALAVPNFPPADDSTFPGRCKQEVKEGAKNQLMRQIGTLLPNAADGDGFRWELLVDPNGAAGDARFDSQYWRANVDPSERYVMSVVDSSQYRPETDGSGFHNLYLTGDWIKTGLNIGSVETAVMAGMQTARAISGVALEIKGERELRPVASAASSGR